MGLCFKVKKEIGEKVRAYLINRDWLDRTRIIGRTMRYLFFPLKKTADTADLKKRFSGSLEQRNLEKIIKKKGKSLKDVLKRLLPADKLEELRRSFDVVGDMLVLEIPDSLKKMEQSIAWNVKRAYPNIKVVAKKGKKTEGKYRIKKVKVLAGAQRTETIHTESDMKLKVDLNKAYFSSRMGSERLRILKQIKKGEDILVMFAGIGPYPILFAKNKDVKIVAIEINPEAVKLMKENIRMNYVGDKIVVYKGDAKKLVPKLKNKFDRIIMSLPISAHEFLPEALKVSKKGTIINLYQFSHEDELDKIKQRAINVAKKSKKKIKILRAVKSGYYSPYVNRYCLDIQVL